MTGPLWDIEPFLRATKGRPMGDMPTIITGISIDSRTVNPGEAFFAVKGERFDGHEFVTRAMARGAALAVVTGERLAGVARGGRPLVVVDDVMEAMYGLAAAARVRSRAKIAAVTGSVGKTGTKDMLLRVLGASGPTHGAPASFNNHWGVPLTLARMPADAEYGVFEIGMNHPGEIAPLSTLVRPHAAIITTVEAVHMAAFNGIEEIAAAKAEIMLGLNGDGVVLLNADNSQYDLLRRLAAGIGVSRIISFGEHPDADARLIEAVLEPHGSTVAARIFGRDITYFLGAPGRHLIQNSLAVLATVAFLGADLELAAASLAEHRAGKGRGERTLLHLPRGGRALLIDESYNANPASMRAALMLLAQAEPGPGGRRIAVLGDMLELGPDEAAHHAGLAGPLVAAQADRVLLAGRLMAHLMEALPPDRRGVYAESAADLESVLIETIGAGDVVVIKGSNGSRMGPLVDALKLRFGTPAFEEAVESGARQGAF